MPSQRWAVVLIIALGLGLGLAVAGVPSRHHDAPIIVPPTSATATTTPGATGP